MLQHLPAFRQRIDILANTAYRPRALNRLQKHITCHDCRPPRAATDGGSWRITSKYARGYVTVSSAYSSPLVDTGSSNCKQSLCLFFGFLCCVFFLIVCYCSQKLQKAD